MAQSAALQLLASQVDHRLSLHRIILGNGFSINGTAGLIRAHSSASWRMVNSSGLPVHRPRMSRSSTASFPRSNRSRNRTNGSGTHPHRASRFTSQGLNDEVITTRPSSGSIRGRRCENPHHPPQHHSYAGSRQGLGDSLALVVATADAVETTQPR